MMNAFTKASIACTLALASMAVSTAPVYAATTSSTNDCSVVMAGSTNTAGAKDSRWTVSADGTVTGTAVVSGKTGCTQTVTLAVWQAPDGVKGLPYSSQKLYGHITETLSVGSHDLSIKLPNCYYQVDMVRGTSATNADGSLPYPTGVMMGSLHGGTQTCDETPATPVAPVTPETPVTPVADVTPEAPAELPNTGVGSTIAFTAAAAAVLGTAFQYVRQLKRA